MKLFPNKKIKIIFFLCLAPVLAGAFAYAVNSYYFSRGPAVIFEIKEGQSGAQIAANLKQSGVIKSEFLFKLALKFFAQPGALKAGFFNLNLNSPAEEVISCVSSGRCLRLEKVTVPEGWRIEETAMALEDANICDNMEFVRLAREQNMEGYLYPSTYMISRNTPPQKVINILKAEFDKRVRPELKPEFMHGLTEREIMTIASIVEREAVTPEERPLIAAVYLNRVKKNMKLDADPTVQYALGYAGRENRFWKRGITKTDLKIDSPYNTYRYKGIPPGPICSPGERSVYAVLHPEPDFDALFFVAEADWTRHVFSKTYEEHNRHVQRTKKLRK